MRDSIPEQTVDPLLSGLSEEAARIIDPAYIVNPACNWYFMIVSTFFIAAAGTWVTEKIVVPRLGPYRGEGTDEGPPEEMGALSSDEKRGLIYALVANVIFTGFLLWGTVPADGFLRDPETGDLLRSPFTQGIVAFIFFGAAIMGVAYGVGAKTIRALALIAELAHGRPASFRDPARFAFAHGGKDGFPYPVDRQNYDRSIEWLRDAVGRARLGNSDRLHALRRLADWEVA